ncbi:MAG TPA: transposase [Terriglobia bacterium]|nr:transposase [Terriglobia bacterium]
MAKPARARESPGTFFVTSSAWERRQIFRSERMATLFIEVVDHYRQEGQYLLHDFVLMPDHFHLLITLRRALTIERAIQLVKGGFSFRAGRELEFKGEIWQRGFTDHIVKDVRDFDSHRNYIRENPVKRGLAARSDEYRFSSVFPGIELDAASEHLRR